MKVSIIGAGQVGGTTAFLLATSNLSDEVVLVDIIEGLAEAKALDIMHSAPLTHITCEVIGTSDYSEIANSDIIVVTAGLPRRSGMSRLDLLEANSKIVKSVVENIKRYAEGSIILMVTNPLDVMCWLAYKLSGFPSKKVFGMAGALDSARLKFYIAQKLKVPYESPQGLVLGTHGDTMVPLLRYSNISGIPVSQLLDEAEENEIIQATKHAGTKIVELLKAGSAYFSTAAAILQMLSAIIRDTKEIIPASAYLQGEYGFDDVYVGVPVKLYKSGILQIVVLELNHIEQIQFRRSVEAVKANIEELKQVISAD